MARVSLALGYTPRCPVDGLAFTEASFRRRSVPLDVDVRELGLVLVDLWDWGWPGGPAIAGLPGLSFERGASHARRKRDIVERVVAPLLAWARETGVAVFHANLGLVLRRYAGWEASTTEEERRRAEPQTGRDAPADEAPRQWPPTDWERAWREEHDRLVWGRGTDWERRLREVSPGMDIPAAVRPEPGEALVFDGAQFHRLLAAARIRVLLYAGFEADECLQFKPYGLANMQLRGYLCCAIREGTTTYESAETLEGLWRTRTALQDIEARFGYTVSAEELLGRPL